MHLVAQALDRMGKHEASKVQRMASLYGLRSSMQGAGKRRIVVVCPGSLALTLSVRLRGCEHNTLA